MSGFVKSTGTGGASAADLQALMEISAPEGEVIPLYSPCYMDIAGSIFTATKNDILKCAVVGIKIGSNTLQNSGIVSNPLWAWTVGSTCYLGNAGAIIQDVDLISTIYSEAIVVLGVAVSATSIDLNIEAPVINGEGQFDKNVFVYYQKTNSQTITSSFTIIDFDGKVEDTHNAVTTGAGWRFTCPVDGYYNISMSTLWASSTLAFVNDTLLYKNGAQLRVISRPDTGLTANSKYTQSSGCITVKLLVGDYIDIRAYNIPSTAMYASTLHNCITIQLLVGQIATWTGDSIVESSSNSNGSWIKYSDGTMICWGVIGSLNVTGSVLVGQIYYYDTPDLSYPAAFYDLPKISVHPNQSSSRSWVSAPTVQTTTTYKISVLAASSTISVAQGFSMIAIGRWKA